MEHLFFECTVRAALFVGATAVVLHAMRVKAAAARHSVWAAMVLVMLALPILGGLGTKGDSAGAPGLGSSNCKRGNSPGCYPFNRLPAIPTRLNLAGGLAGCLSAGTVLAPVPAGNRDHPRTQTGSRRDPPRQNAHQPLMRRACDGGILQSSGDFTGALEPMVQDAARRRLDARG